jgi:ABC-type phosphonate transport system ATPase subunit
MNPLVHEILAVLDAHPLVSDIKIVHLDETPTGRLEVKIRTTLLSLLLRIIFMMNATASAVRCLRGNPRRFANCPLRDFAVA